MLTKSKEEIAWAAREAALNAMKSHASVGWNMSSNTMMGQLTELIALAVQAGVAEVLKSTYTNEEFDKDIGL